MKAFEINGRPIGPGHPTYIVAELSANHHQDIRKAIELIREAKAAGADAVKIQTYTADTITLQSDAEPFRIKGTIWNGRTLYELYQEAHTPWEWHPELRAVAEGLGLLLFSSPFDVTAVEFLEQQKVPVYKIASPEIVDIPLIRAVAQTRKPILISTGMATLEEIDEAIETIRKISSSSICLLKCTSAYPARPDQMNLKWITELSRRYDVPVGLSDHTLDITVPIASVALGACVIEKHFIHKRSEGGPDSEFSLEPSEFRVMVEKVRTTERALGSGRLEIAEDEKNIRIYRKSLFVTQDMKKGETFSPNNMRPIRPGHGLHTRFYEEVLKKKATRDVARGTPLSWDLVE